MLAFQLLLLTLSLPSLAQSGQLDQQSIGSEYHSFEFDEARSWHQQVKVGAAGMLEGITILTTGDAGVPMRVKIRAGGAPSSVPNSNPILFDKVITKPTSGVDQVFVDMTAAALTFVAGDIFVMEVGRASSLGVPAGQAWIVGYKDSPLPYSEPLCVSNFSYYYCINEALVFTTYRVVEYCGNNTIDAGEVCDDGNSTAGDGCSADCESDETCGNGVVDGSVGEQCDDGNGETGDGCGVTCELEVCGNHIVDPGEVCDDGNAMAGDGCSADCLSNETCGNGVIDVATGEACDEGDHLDADGCQANCALPSCGDGIVDDDEVCDDGNNVDGDGCNGTCTSYETCGNDVVDKEAGEVCDEGQDNDGAGPCGTDCRIVADTTGGLVQAAGGYGCVVANAPAQTARWWLLSLAMVVPLVRRRRR